MKPAPFDYVRPGTVDDALAELAGDSAKVLAGGQSLVPVLAMRLARPSTLVDINAIDGLDEVSVTGDGLRVGATVRQRALQADPSAASVPLLRMAFPFVGHRELRSRGTVCGSLAHADPAAELPAVACCLDAIVTVRGPAGERSVAATDFFTGAMATAVRPDELVTAVTFPVAGEHEGFGFAEMARRHGDFALAGVVVRVSAVDAQRASARLVGFGISDTPVTHDFSDGLAAAVAATGGSVAEEALVAALEEPARAAAAAVVTTTGDEHASTAYRQRVFAALAARETARAFARATRGRE
ncbi:MAG: FAD binding domain-containing protein [Streptosporangiales bacterium]